MNFNIDMTTFILSSLMHSKNKFELFCKGILKKSNEGPKANNVTTNFANMTKPSHYCFSKVNNKLTRKSRVSYFIGDGMGQKGQDLLLMVVMTTSLRDFLLSGVR